MKWNDHAEYWLFRAGVCAGAVLPAGPRRALWLRAGRWLGRHGGYRRRLVRNQMAAVYPQRSADQLGAMVEAAYEHLGATVAETFWPPAMDLKHEVEVLPGWSQLDVLMARGGGVLVVTAHLGNFEWGGRVLAARYPVLDVVKPMRNALFDRYLQRERKRHGIKTVAMDQSGRAVLSHLRSGGMVTLLIDQDAGPAGVRTDFLGRPASTWPGAARLAVRTRCPVVPVAIVRQAGGGHVLHIGEAIDCTNATAAEADIQALTGRLSAAVESYIHAYPEQWFWVHRRWKGAAEARTYYEASGSGR